MSDTPRSSDPERTVDRPLPETPGVSDPGATRCSNLPAPPPDPDSDPQRTTYTASEGGTAAAGPAGRFRVLRFHAEGGMGQVSVAVDGELQREVAFKEIQPRFAGDPRVV